MIRYYDKNGKPTGWLSDKPKEYELKRLTIDQLQMIAKRKRGLKKILIGFLAEK